MTRKETAAFVLAIACILALIGGAFAADNWFNGANKDTNITTGQTITMLLGDPSVSDGTGTDMYPGDTAIITISANNKNVAATLTIELKDSTDQTDYSQYFDIKYSLGSDDQAYSEGIALAGQTDAYSITLKLTLKTDAPVSMAAKTIKVTISLDKAQ